MAQFPLNFSTVAEKKHQHITLYVSDANTFGKVLCIVEVDFAKAAVPLHQVILGSAQIDLTVLGSNTQNPGHNLTALFDNYYELSQFSKSSLTSSQFCSSLTQKRARWKLLLSVRSEETTRLSDFTTLVTTQALK